METVSTVIRTSTHEYRPGLFIDITRPAHSRDPLPMIIWLHGGGWRMQDRTARPKLLKHFAIHDYMMASIDYRLTPHTRHPGQLYDVRAAIRWLRRQAADLGCDPTRIGLWGSSAGAHLAALAALSPGDRRRVTPGVRAVVAGYGPADLTDAAPGSPEADLLGGAAGGRPALARDASPALQAHPDAPAFLLLHGRADTLVPPTHSIALYDALSTHGNDVALYLIDGFGHGFLNPGDVLELGPGRALDQGHLEREPAARATVHAAGRLSRFADAHPHASFATIEAFFAHTLKDRS